MRRVRNVKRIYCPSIHCLVIVLLKIARWAYVWSFLFRVRVDTAPFDKGKVLLPQLQVEPGYCGTIEESGAVSNVVSIGSGRFHVISCMMRGRW